jgi:hypothetical protein
MTNADARPGRLTAAEMFALADAGLLPEKLELVDGRLLTAGDSEYVFAPPEARAAARLGIRVRTCVDAALEDPETREALRRRLL